MMRLEADWYVVCEGCGLRVRARGETPVIPPHFAGGRRMANESECIGARREALEASCIPASRISSP